MRNKEVERNARQRYRERNPEKVKQQSRDWRKRNLAKAKLKERASRVKRVYGISLQEYDEILSRGCEICGRTERLHLDHCHETGKVRGCLCAKCNMGIGLFDDNPDILLVASTYLQPTRR